MTEMIQREMELSINEYTDPEIGKWLIEFTREKGKENFPFGKLAISHYRLFGGKSEGIYRAAAALEFLILSSDIFDDLQDMDNPSKPWSQIDPVLALNLGIACQTLSQMLFSQLKFPEMVRKDLLPYVNRMVLQAITGQQKDILNECTREDDYLQMVEEKSGSLMALASLTGTILSGGNYALEEIRRIGQWFGLVAQLQNDMRDAMRWDVKNDFLRKKKTLPILYLLNKEQGEYRIFKDYYEGRVVQAEVLQRKIEIIELMKKSGVIEYISVFIQLYLIKMEEKIAEIAISQQEKEGLKQIYSI